MKRILSFVFIVIFIFTMSGCKKSEQQTPNNSADNFDIKIATNLIDTYMEYLIRQDYENAKKLYSDQLIKKDKSNLYGELKVRGYKVDDINEVGNTGIFKVYIVRDSLEKPISELDECKIKIIKEDSGYKIDEVDSITQKEAFLSYNGIRLKVKTNAKTSLIVDKDGIPHYIFLRDDKENKGKLNVPREFGIISLSYDGESVIVTTYDVNSYIGIIKIDESLAVQGQKASSGSDSNAGQSASQGGKEMMSSPRETPIGKEITNVDMIMDSKINYGTFSQDQKFIAVQYTNKKFGKGIEIYSTSDGNKIPFDFEKKFPHKKVEVEFSSFQKDAVNFQVTSKGKQDIETADLIGKWQIDLVDFKAKRL